MREGKTLEGGTRHIKSVESDESSSGHTAETQTRHGQDQAEGASTNAATNQETPSETVCTTPQPDLLFVTYTGPSDIASRNLRHVRSHVMHQHLRRRRTKLGRSDTIEEAMAEVKRPRMDLLTRAGRVDPFGTLSVTMTRAMSRLFDHYTTILSPLHYPPSRSSICNPMTTRWVPMAIRDPALLHSTICSACGHLALLAGTLGLENSEYLTHKMETIRLVNERMTGLSQATTDETIGAIALLVTDQVVDGDYKEMAVHMKGLAELVKLRGGLQALGMSGVLAGEIQWCDIVTAFMTSSAPLLPLLEAQGGIKEQFSSSPLQRCFSSDVPAQSSLNQKSLSENLSGDLIRVYRDMYILTAMLNLKRDFSETDMLVFDRKRASIQHRLASMPPTSSDAMDLGSEAQSETNAHMQDACRIAGILYSNMTLWGFQPPMRFYGDLAITLQQTLRRMDLERYQGGGVWNDILLWILFLGGYAALNRPERAWFVGLLANIGNKREACGFEIVKKALVRIVYYDGLEKSFEILWKEAQESLVVKSNS